MLSSWNNWNTPKKIHYNLTLRCHAGIIPNFMQPSYGKFVSKPLENVVSGQAASLSVLSWRMDE